MPAAPVPAATRALLADPGRAIGCRGIWPGTETDNAAARAPCRRLGGRETPAIVIYDRDGAMDG